MSLQEMRGSVRERNLVCIVRYVTEHSSLRDFCDTVGVGLGERVGVSVGDGVAVGVIVGVIVGV